MKNKNVCFVIVTYKSNKEMLHRLMAAIREYRAIVVDNTENNIGYGGAANQGMKQAFDAGAEWVIVCNQDVRMSKAGIAHFCAMAQKCAPGIVGPEAGTLDPKRWTTVLASRPGLVPDDMLLYISGSLIALHKDVWLSTGGFFEPYFMYYEDADLCERARQRGFSVRQIPIEGFRHGVPDSSNSVGRQSGDDRLSKEYYLARNHLLFVRRLAPLSVKIHELLRLPKSIAEHQATGNTDAIRGISDFAVGRFGKQR
ncbi:MAG: hypothetical protein Q8L37_02055 [Candidatus Gottesmanbacteria bacterium]|nr:hypothetical protein [Candidatus Gottesmanbacteria bacterium]